MDRLLITRAQRSPRGRTRAVASWFAGLGLCLVSFLAAGPAPTADDEQAVIDPEAGYYHVPGFWFLDPISGEPRRIAGIDDQRQLAIFVNAPGDPRQLLGEVLSEFGSKITHVTQHPDGGWLVSADKPTDHAVDETLRARLRTVPGVEFVEGNVCFEYYPEDIVPEVLRNLLTPPGPTPEEFLLGQVPPWDPSGLTVYEGPEGVTYQSTGEAVSFPELLEKGEAGAGSGILERGVERDEVERGQILTQPGQSTVTAIGVTRERPRPTETRVHRSVGWTQVRDPPPTTPGTTPPPPEYPGGTPPPTITDDLRLACSDPTMAHDPGEPVKVGYKTGDPGLFPYPRPIPIQALARDYDQVQYSCEGCGGGASNQRLIVEDSVPAEAFLWFLDGKGSLNEPFEDLPSDTEEEIEKLRQRIKENSEKLAALQARKDELDATREERRKALEDEIADLEASRNDTVSQLAELEPELERVRAELDEERSKLAAARQRIAELESEIDELRGRIQELQDRIDGKPSAEEQQIAAQIEAIEAQIEALRVQYAALQQQNVAAEQGLRQAYDQAARNLADARRDLAQIRARAQAKQDEITAIENRLYSSPLLVDLATGRAAMIREAISLENGFLRGSLQDVTELNDLVQQFVTTPPSQRQALLDRFNGELTGVVAGLRDGCEGLAPDTRAACLARVESLEAELNGLADTLGQAITSPAGGGTPADWEALARGRDELAALEGQVRTAESRVAAAEEAQIQAQQTYLAGLRQLEDAERRLRDQIADLEAQLQTLNADLDAAHARGEAERLRMTPQWLDEIAELRRRIEELEGRLTDERLKAESAQVRVDELEAGLNSLEARKRELENRRDYLQEQIDRKRRQLEDLDSETEALEEEIEKLKQEIEKDKAALAALLAGIEGMATKNQEAAGQQVFFIPPPLEFTDGFDKDEFERLKKALAEKEADFQRARAAKTQLQDQAFGLLKGMTEQLWALRGAKDTLEPLEDEIAQLESDRDKAQTDAVHAHNETVAREQQRKAELEGEKAEEEARVGEAERAEEIEEKKVEETEAELEKVTQQIAEARQVVEQKGAAVDSARAQYDSANQELERLKAEIEQAVSRLRATEAELGRAQQALARASARDDEAAMAAARAEVDRLRLEHEQVDQAVTRLRVQLDSQAGVVLARQDVHSAALKEWRVAETRVRELRDEQRFQQRLLNTRHDALKEAIEERLAAERAVRKTEDEIKRQDEKIKTAQEAQQKAGEDDAEVKSLQEQIDDKTAAKDEAEQAKNKAMNRLAALKTQREGWEKRKEEAESALDDAEKALERARDELDAFLVDSFNHVRLTVTLKLIGVDDTPLDDGFRSDDPAADTKTFVIRYEGRREPTITGPADDLEPPQPPPATPALCMIEADYLPESQPNLSVDPEPLVTAHEPQTIALFYRQGEPLYDLWPPRKPFDGILVAAATRFQTGGKDNDKLAARCAPGGGDAILVGPASGVPSPAGSAPRACEAGGESGGEPADVAHATWATDTYTSPVELDTMVNVPEVTEPDQCEGETELQVLYSDSKLQFPDEDDKKKKYLRRTGLLGDAPLEYRYFGKDNKVELRFQVFDGAHKGKSGETVEWKVTGVEPGDLPPEDYGLDGGREKELTRETDGAGYSRVDFFLDERYGKATVSAKWKRQDTDCESLEIEVIRPLELRHIRTGFAPRHGWDQGQEVFDGSTDYEGLADQLPEDGPATAPSIAVGLVDELRDPVDERKIDFSVVEPDAAGIDPESMETRVYGLAWSFATDVPAEAQLKLKAKVDPPLEPVTEPAEVEGEQSTETENRFKIGREGAYLTIETDEPFVPGEAYSGGAKLVLETDAGDIPVGFKELSLEAEAIVVEESDGALVAAAGAVTWSASLAGSEAFSFEVNAIRFLLESLGLTAGADGKITGKVEIPGRTEEADASQVAFEAQIGPAGFYGRLSDFPEMEFASLKLEKGAALIVDMHRQEDPEHLDLKGNWTGKGLVIEQASLLLPESMKGDAETPPKISVKSLFFNSTGLNGEIDVEYTVGAKLGSIDFAIEKVAVGFAAGDLVKGEFGGKMTLADPFHGAIGMKMYLDREGKYSFEVSTDKPVTAPSLGLTFTLRKVKGEYASEVFTFELEALLRSETFSELNIDKLVVKSTGDVEADIGINKDITIGRGFDAHLGSFYFKKTESELELALREAQFKFGETLKAEGVTVEIGTGPAIKKFKMHIDANRDPVKFAADIDYEGNSFEGSLLVEVENVMKVDGTFVLGTQQRSDETEFTYWYIELVVGSRIYLGQTGLAIFELGGGVGYNYDPPIGDAPGVVRDTGAFSLKALMGAGLLPNGEVFNSRLTMVLVSGRFSLNGRVWVLDKESSMFGEGQLDLYWSDPARMEGFVRLVMALADAEGKLLRFNGQVDFRFAGPNDWYIKSRTLEGALLERLLAEGTIEVERGLARLEGNVRYDLNKSVPLAVVTLAVQVNLRADGALEFRVTDTGASLDARLGFRGYLDATVETSVKNFTLATVTIETTLALAASNQSISVSGTATVAWDTWVHSGSADVEIGFSR